VLIDRFTVAAQVVNFLVLVWLLRRFLYRPIVDAMETRQRRIDDEVAEADRLRAEASAERARLQAEADRFDDELRRRERRAREELEATGRAQLTQARAELDQLQAQWRDAVRREEASFLALLRQRTGEQVVEVVRRTVRDLADAPLEQLVIERFLDRLEALAPGDRAALVTAARADRDRLRLRTAFELPESLRDRVATAVERALGRRFALRFEVAPPLLAGVELCAGGRTLAWTFDDHLDALEQAVAEALGEDWRGREHA
jgi:F-type H+-transporting ATPase subunit b